MLLELLTYLTTPCPQWARRHGYLTHAIALQERHRRCRRVWTNHAEHCRRLILESAALCRSRRKAIILGSGLLFEIPLSALAEQFETIILVDVIHLRSSHNLARAVSKRFPSTRIYFEHADLTGLAAPLPAWLTKDGFDFAVSSCLLSQLPLVPLDRLCSSFPLNQTTDAIKKEERRLAQELIHNHLILLNKIAKTVCLITDVESIRKPLGAQSTEPIEPPLDLLWGVSLPPPDQSWQWIIAPSPEDDQNFDRIASVTGYRDFTLSPNKK
ncbi:Class I SAM-dependent methyltransferase [Azospirillaceae bacterium]